ncbi:DUF1801 domain-containing protein [Limibacter armeniacum]|uniref:DUF1801 domain-containing protein n=1 Tax=Limibacter armeniacum TaxID=466084 RepID=UPI002FE6B5FC
MKSDATTPESYLNELPEDRRTVMQKIREVILENLPEGFEEVMNYGMIGYVVPHSIYPAGYHCNTDNPLPFISLASQKNYIGLYHMGIYADVELMDWFKAEYAKVITTKLDMGKSCIRLKKMDQVPYELIGELVSKITPEQWVKTYEAALKKPM